MKKHLGSIIIVGVLFFVILGVVVVSAIFSPKFVEEITYDEYKKGVESLDNAFLYVGDNSNLNTLTDLAKSKRITIYYLDSDKITDEQRKEITTSSKSNNQLIAWNNDNDYKYDGDFTSYKFKKYLIDNELISNSIIEVTIKEYKDLVKNKDTKYMFIGSASCSYCTKFRPEIESVASKNPDIKFYYIDLAKITSQEDYDSFVETDKYLTENNWGTPLSFLYKDGKRIGEISGYVSASEVTQFLKDKGVVK